MEHILAFDQGTTSSRAVVYGKSGGPVAQESIRHGQIYEKPGWVSHNAAEIYDNIIRAGKTAIERAGTARGVRAVGIANQRETVVAWDKRTGEPVCNAIVWLDKRTADMGRKIKTDGFEPVVRAKTGLLADPYFSATKIKWILDNVSEARALLAKNRLAFGTMDSYLIFRLTGGKRHVTDCTNASRTMLFNIYDLKWDGELLRYFGIPEETLPEVTPSSGVVGYTDEAVFGSPFPIAGIAGDQQAALFGQGCFNGGDVKCTYGTGCFILLNIGESPERAARADNGSHLVTIAWNIGGKTIYAAECSVFNAGSAIDWLINDLKLLKDAGELDDILNERSDPGGVYFVPAFSGLGAPAWDMGARAAAFGITLGAGKNELTRAVCDSISYSVYGALDYLENTAGMKIGKLFADGGVSRNDNMMRFQADILNMPVYRPANIETTSLGAAGLAGLATGVFTSPDEIARLLGPVTEFSPGMAEDERGLRLAMWRKASERAAGWVN